MVSKENAGRHRLLGKRHLSLPEDFWRISGRRGMADRPKGLLAVTCVHIQSSWFGFHAEASQTLHLYGDGGLISDLSENER